MNIEEMRKLDATKTYLELEEANKYIKRLEEAGDNLANDHNPFTFIDWVKVREAKP